MTAVVLCLGLCLGMEGFAKNAAPCDIDLSGFTMRFEYAPEVELNPSLYRAFYNGREIRMSPSRFAVLEELLLAAPGQVSDAELYFAVKSARGQPESEEDDLRAIVKNMLDDLAVSFRKQGQDPRFHHIGKRHETGYYWISDSAPTVPMGPFQIARHQPWVALDKNKISLSNNEYELLIRTAKGQGAVVRYEHLQATAPLSHLQPEDFRFLANLINRKLGKLLTAAQKSKYPVIKAVYRLGYQITRPDTAALSQIF